MQKYRTIALSDKWALGLMSRRIHFDEVNTVTVISSEGPLRIIAYYDKSVVLRKNS